MFIQESNSELGEKLREYQVASKNQSVVIENVPVQIYYDEENLVVSGVPNTVNVKISGPKSIVIQAKSQRDFQVAIYLTDPEIGNQKASFVTKNLSDKLKATIIPGYITVNVQERITKSFAVETIVKDLKLEEGYSIEEKFGIPGNVMVIGGKDVVEKIAHVYAVVDSKEPISKDFKRDVVLIAVDNKSNKLNVIITPDKVEINIKLNIPSKDIPIDAKIIGEPTKGYLVESVTLSKTDVTVFSKDASFNGITSISLPIDVSGKTESFEVDVPLVLPDAIVNASHNSVKAVVNIVLESTKTLNDLTVKVLNVDPQKYDVKFPDGDKVDLIVRGSSVNVNAAQASQFTITIDGVNLEAGIKTVKIHVAGPDNIKWNLSSEEITLELIKK
jgi:YbbR domain-containing protein